MSQSPHDLAARIAEMCAYACRDGGLVLDASNEIDHAIALARADERQHCHAVARELVEIGLRMAGIKKSVTDGIVGALDAAFDAMEEE